MSKSDGNKMLELQYLELKYSSDKAFLVVFDPDISVEPVWIPKSQCEIIEDTRCIYLKKWIAKEKGLIPDE